MVKAVVGANWGDEGKGKIVEDKQIETIEAVDRRLKAKIAAGDLQLLHEIGGSGEQNAVAVLD